MVLLASARSSSLMSSWPRMQSGQKNPFQNAPGPFIYALPNLAGTCPFSCSSDPLLFCSFPGDSNAPSASDPHYPHRDRCCRSPAETSRCSDSCCHYDPPSAESAELLPTAFTKEGAPNTEPPPRPRPSAPSLSPSDECHFGLGDLISLSPLTEGETEAEQQQQQEKHEKQQQESQASAPPTPTRSNAPSSPTGSDFQEGSGSKEDGGEGEGEVDGDGDRKRKKVRGRRGRRRNRKQATGRSQAEHGANSIAPRFMGISGIHYGLWAQYVCPQAPPLPVYPPPPAMNHHHYGGFVVPPNTVTSSPAPAPLFWNPMVPATGFVAVPVV